MTMKINWVCSDVGFIVLFNMSLKVYEVHICREWMEIAHDLEQ